MNTDGVVLNLKTTEGFEMVYEAFSNKMYKIGYSKTGDKDITREIIQEIFKSLWERRNTLEINGVIEHYLMRALKFKIIDHYRSVVTAKKKNTEILNGYTEYTHSTEEDIAFNELQEKVEKVVDKLPSRCKEVYQLSREQGFSNKEIALNLLISERAVAYHISNALTSLKKELALFYTPRVAMMGVVFILTTAFI